MHVLMINGSPHREGCTYTALAEVAGQLEAQGIEAKFFHIGSGAIRAVPAAVPVPRAGTASSTMTL